MGSLTPTHRWRLPDPLTLSPAFSAAAAERGLSARAASLLAGRGHGSPSDLAAFLDPPAHALHDPHLLPDSAAFVGRLALALERAERVMVFGDFDADGVTGLAILTLALRHLGLEVVPYVPDRGSEGHGLSQEAVLLAEEQRCAVIITVDTGTSSVAEVAQARGKGIEVLVTDHHHVPAERPMAGALVNPHRPDSGYPDDRLAGSGVAFKLAQLLLDELGDEPDQALVLADLAVIGTVADVVPIVGENRAIARLGLEGLRAAHRPGLRALLMAARSDPAKVDLDAIAYQIAPRLNAGGRMGEARLAAELLLAGDEATATALAERLEAANLARREATATALTEARRLADSDPGAPAVVVAADWPVGIVGLVAGRLAEERGRPAVVAATGLPSWRVSARAPEGFDLARAFVECGDLLERHGGHPQAAGCQLDPSRFPAFRARLYEMFGAVGSAGDPTRDGRPELRLDLAVPAADVDYRLLRDLEALDPTGPGNGPPLVGVAGLGVSRVRAANGGHASLTLRKGREVLDAIAFDRSDLIEIIQEGDHLDVVARLASRTFGGYESLQLELRDVAPAGHLDRLAAIDAARGPAHLTAATL